MGDHRAVVGEDWAATGRSAEGDRSPEGGGQRGVEAYKVEVGEN